MKHLNFFPVTYKMFTALIAVSTIFICCFSLGGVAKAQTQVAGGINKFNITVGTQIQTTANLNVRETPTKSGAFISVKPRNSRGVVIQGPVLAGGYYWYNVDYEIGLSGWSIGNWLGRISTTTTIRNGTSTANITTLTADPINVPNVSAPVTLSWDTTGVNRCWLYSSANALAISDINPHSSSFVVTPAWKIDATHNHAQVLYTLNCLDSMATNTNNLLTKTVAVTLGTSTVQAFATTTVDQLGLGLLTPIQTTGTLNVRSTPGLFGAIIGTKPAGSRGIITQGPQFADGRYWYYVDYEVGVDGWNASGWLAKRLSTSTVTTYATATITSFSANISTVDATNTPITFSWQTQGVLRCTLLNSSDINLPAIVDNTPASGQYTLIPTWRKANANSTSITFTLSCQDASARVRKLVEAQTTVTYSGAAAASGHITAIDLTQSTPFFSGSAYGTSIVSLTIFNSSGVTVGTINDIPVTSNLWSKSLVDGLAAGKYTLFLNANNTTEVDHKVFTVTSTAILGFYRGYINGAQFTATDNISRSDALASCMLNASQNPTAKARCTWNGQQIFSNNGSVTATTTANIN